MAEPVAPSVSTTSTAPESLQPSESAGKATSPAGTPSLTRTIWGLKWILFKRSFRKNWGMIIGTIVGCLYALGGLTMLCIALSAPLVAGKSDALGMIIRALGVGLLLGWTILPQLTFGMDDSLSPVRFAAYGRSAKALQWPVFLASLISPAVLITLLALLAAMVAQIVWFVGALTGAIESPETTTPGLVAALMAVIPASALGLALCVLIPRSIWSWRSTMRMSKRKRETLQALTFVGVIAVAYSFGFLGGAGTMFDKIAAIFTKLIAILVWTPWGAPLALPVDLAEGAYLAAAAKLLISLATGAALWLWWRHTFEQSQLQALKGASGDKAQKVTDLVPRFMPSNALGAVAGKSLRYWRRDTRYSMAALIMPLMGVFFIAMSYLVPDSEGMAYVAVAVTAWVAGMTISNEMGFDGPSGWVNITASINNRANLLGRFYAFGVFLLPWMTLLGVLVPLLRGEPQVIGLTLPLSYGFVASSWGISMVASALLPYPAPAPGSLKNSGGGNALVSTLLVSLGTWVPMIPAAILVILGFTWMPGLEYAGAAVALVIGIAMFVVCLRVASARLDRTYPDVLQKVKTFAGN